VPERFAGDGELSDAASPTDAAPSLAPPKPVLEFDVAAADLPRLLRSPVLAALRDGRARSVPLRTVWHDTTAGDLAADGLAIAEQGGVWRLEKLQPNGAGDWPPAAPAPVLAEAAALDKLRPDLPQDFAGPLVPVAAFTGRHRSFSLHSAGGPARLEVLEGTLRGVAHDQPACRLMLFGPPDAMAALAIELDRHIRLEVPRAGLAAGALAVAHDRDAPPRQLGAPLVPPGHNLSDAIALVTGHLTDVILHWAKLTHAGTNPEPVHQIRVAVRRLRSALAIFRRSVPDAPFATMATELRDLATRLGAARDWDVFLGGTGEAVQLAFSGDKRVAALLTAAARKRATAYDALGTYLSGDAWHHLALRLALLPTLRPWQETQDPAQRERLAAPAVDFATAALQRQRKRVLAAGEDFSSLAPLALHEVRKQVKKLRYSSEFFAPLFAAKQVRRFVEKLVDLQEALGVVNDGTVAASLMTELAGGVDRAFALGVVRGYVAAIGTQAASDAGRAWRKLTQASPFWE
jgi:CHAD domain-containing protein